MHEEINNTSCSTKLYFFVTRVGGGEGNEITHDNVDEMMEFTIRRNVVY